ncbi:ventricular natriuretic peptide-like [Sphaerodactylus townsendi]|uniref:Uncharacterized protein n=1 Tax=Sphaerodactylus townsendi TaxID=933632 RepID=A0ACB8EEP8_9SAUR|nr:ventricular natriuretic peptide-like [Sphaerodactylus townsendi]
MTGSITLGCCWSLLLLLCLQGLLGSAHPVTWNPPSQELQSLQDLLERLKEKFPEGEKDPLELEASDYGADPADDDTDFDLLLSLLDLQSPLKQAEMEEQWRTFLASPKRRHHFSGCFGTRLERIGSRTGLGCNFFKARSRRKPRS